MLRYVATACSVSSRSVLCRGREKVMYRGRARGEGVFMAPVSPDVSQCCICGTHNTVYMKLVQIHDRRIYKMLDTGDTVYWSIPVCKISQKTEQ